jgi:FLVCR family MFS transporter 7
LTANTVMNLGSPIGTAFIFVVSPIIVRSSDPSTINMLNLTTFVMAIIIAIPSLFIQNLPPTPPSRSASVASEPFWRGARLILCNRIYLLLLFVFSLLIGSYNAFTTLLSSYLSALDYTQSDSGNIGAVFILLGIVSAGMIGPLLDRFKNYQLLTFKLLISGTGICLIFFTYVTAFHITALLYVCVAAFGTCVIPLMPLCLELGADCTFPVAEGTSSGVMWACGTLLGVIMTVLARPLTDADGTMEHELILIAASLVLAAFVAFFYQVSRLGDDLVN